MNGDEQFTALEKAVRTMDNIHVAGRTAGSITLQYRDEGGGGTVRRCALFPGVFLGFNDVETSRFPRFKGEIARGYKVNFCIDGRCEVKMSDGMYLFLESGDFSFTSLTVSDNFSLPYERYHGIELHIYDSALKGVPPPPLGQFGVDLAGLCKKFCPAAGNFVARADERIRSVFLAMSGAVPGHETDYLRLKVTELLFLLMYTRVTG
jgi:hypothetical protein